MFQLNDRVAVVKKRKRVGRGGSRGGTAGKGHKGQKARAGGQRKLRACFEGGQMPLFRRLPKRGFKNIFALKFSEVNLGRLQAAIDAGKLDAKSTINAEALLASGLLRRAYDGVRLLGFGELKAKIKIEVVGASKAAIEAVKKAGGEVILLQPQALEAAE